jgi:hypothetical protein
MSPVQRALVDELRPIGDVLENRLRELNWDMKVRRVGASFMFGVGQPRNERPIAK